MWLYFERNKNYCKFWVIRLIGSSVMVPYMAYVLAEQAAHFGKLAYIILSRVDCSSRRIVLLTATTGCPKTPNRWISFSYMITGKYTHSHTIFMPEILFSGTFLYIRTDSLIYLF